MATTWLYRVVSNSALGYLRRTKPTVPLEALPSEPSAAPEGEPEYVALRGERVATVLRAIAALEPSQRVPLVLHELEGIGYEQVAEILDVSVPSLHSRLHRARVTMLSRLKELR